MPTHRKRSIQKMICVKINLTEYVFNFKVSNEVPKENTTKVTFQWRDITFL